MCVKIENYSPAKAFNVFFVLTLRPLFYFCIWKVTYSGPSILQPFILRPPCI